MREVGVLEARTKFSALLTSIEQGGGDIVITRNGKPVARMVAEGVRRVAGPASADRIRAIRKGAERRGGAVMDLARAVREIRDGED